MRYTNYLYLYLNLYLFLPLGETWAGAYSHAVCDALSVYFIGMYCILSYVLSGRFRAAVPSGASTGIHEALELRDKGAGYHGKGSKTFVICIFDTMVHV